MKVSQALRERRSIRAFLEQPVERQLLRDLLRQAARAPSSGNLQPWRIHVVQGQALQGFRQVMQQRLADSPEPDPADYAVYPQPLQESYRTSRFEVGEQMYALLGVGRGDKAERLAWFARNYAFFDAPCALFFFVERNMGPGQWADLGMYQQSLMLLLKEHGLDSCPQACWARYHQTVEAFLQMPPELMLHCAIAVGYADPQARVNQLRSERRALEQFCTFVN